MSKPEEITFILNLVDGSLKNKPGEKKFKLFTLVLVGASDLNMKLVERRRKATFIIMGAASICIVRLCFVLVWRLK